MNTLFFRLLDAEDKGTALQEAVAALPQSPTPEAFAVNPGSFNLVPRSPFSYWVSQKALRTFVAKNKIETEGRLARITNPVADNDRFIRTSWEVPYKQERNSTSEWTPLQKGGSFNRYYSDIHLLVDWDFSIQSYKGFLGTSHRPLVRPASVDFFFRPGINWPCRSQKGLSMRALPGQCIFGSKGPAIFIEGDTSKDLLALLAITNSSIFCELVELQMAFGSYEVGVIQRTPVPDLASKETDILAPLARRAWSLKRNLDTITQTSHAFILPALLQVQGATLSDRAQAWAETVAATEQELADIQAKIDALAFELYGISPEEVGGEKPGERSQESEADVDDEDEDDAVEGADLPSLVHGLVEYALGVAFGRFDLRLATGEREHPPEPEPFDPLPACSPGMLVVERSEEAEGRSQNSEVRSQPDNLPPCPPSPLPPISEADLPPNYPIAIPFNGILVDDEGHPNDIVTRIRQVLDLIWGDQAGDIEQEACQVLRGSSLREYFARSSAFFAEHLSRYSKSRRQAPIYWPLSTRSGSYTLWLYYHRLTDQTLYTCINDFVEPKLHQVNQVTTQLRSKTDRTRDEEKRLETLQDLELELIEFRDELLRIAQLPWKPNLNDGVQITAAPLEELFALRKWQTKLKGTWKKLGQGEYDWAHLAYTIWPDRVREKCKGDKSLAIAHDLEDLYEEPTEANTNRRRRT